MLIVEKTDSAIPLALSVSQAGVGGVTGLSPTVAIRRGDSATLYFDWTDGTFKNAGWGSKYGAMLEVERGHYVAFLDASAAAGILAGQTLVVEYHVDDGAAVKGDTHELLTVVASLYSLALDATVTSRPDLAAIVAALPSLAGIAGAVPTLAAIIAGVLDELVAAHAGAGSVGEAIATAAAGGGGAGLDLTVEGA